MAESALKSAENIVSKKDQPMSIGQMSRINAPGALPWKDVFRSDDYRNLNASAQAQVKLQYFDDVVTPNIPESQYSMIREEFLNYASRLEIERATPSFWGNVVGKTILKAPGRGLGMVLGFFAGLPGFALAGMTERELNKEEFDKMPFWQQTLVSLGAGFTSLAEATFKEGEWGVRYNDYYKAVTGKSIYEDLPVGLKWAAPTVEFLAESSFDPFITEGTIGSLVRAKVPAHWIGNLPKKVVQDLERIEQLDDIRKAQLQQKLTEILKNRTEYMKWWQDREPMLSRQGEKILEKNLRTVENKLTELEPGWRARASKELQEAQKTTEPILSGERDPFDTLTAPRQAQVGQPKRDFETVRDVAEDIKLAEKERLESQITPLEKLFEKEYVEDAAITMKDGSVYRAQTHTQAFDQIPVSKQDDILDADAFITNKDRILTREKATELTKATGEDATDIVGKTIKPEEPPVFTHKGITAEKIAATEAINRFRASKGWGPIDDVPVEDLREMQRANDLKKLNAFRRKKGLPPIKARAIGGLIAGIEEDENGNIRYNLSKGMAGALAVAGGVQFIDLNKAKKFTRTLLANPEWAKVNGTIGKESKAFSLSGLLGRFNTAFFDRFSRMKMFSEKTYVAARVFSAYKDEAVIKFNELKEAFKPVKDDEVLVSDYINAHRMLSRAKSGIQNPDGVTAAEAQIAIRQIERYYESFGKNVDDLRNAKDAFNKWTDDYILREAFESGVISKAGYEAIKKGNKFYATFDVLDHLPDDLQRMTGMPAKEFFSVSGQKVIQKMVGTEKQIRDPLEATIKKFTEAQALFARNKVANTFIDDPAAKEFIRPVASSKKEFAIMKEKGLNPVMEGAWDKSRFDTVNRMKNGEVERYLTDKEMADAMKQLTPFQAPKAIQAINSLFRKAATTVYIPFTISNAFRDGLMAYTTSPVYKTKDLPKFTKDWVGGFWEGMKHEFAGASALTEEYIKSGGGFGYVGNLREAQLAKKAIFEKTLKGKAWSVVKSPFDLLEHISATVELAPRLGVFKRAKMTGLPPGDAALMAKQATIDFNRGGTYTKIANQFIPFLNARVQGRVTVAAALKRDPKGTLSKIFTATVLPGMAAYAWNRLYYSKEYDDIPEYIKQNYFTIITGTETNKETGKEVPTYIVIPKGDVGQLSWNPLEYGIDTMLGKNPETVKAFLVNYLSDLSPVEFARRGEVSLSKAAGSLLPPIVKGFAEDWANLSFYRGTEIVPYYMGKSKPPELQYKENTPEFYKWLGEQTGIAPLRLQNFASNILAGYGREGLSPSSMMRGLKGRLVKTTGGAIEQRAWTTIKDIEQGYIYIRAYAQEMVKDGDIEGAVNIIRQWNATLPDIVEKFNDEFSQYGITDKGGIISSYGFHKRKVANILRRSKKKNITKESPLDKKLRRGNR